MEKILIPVFTVCESFDDRFIESMSLHTISRNAPSGLLYKSLYYIWEVWLEIHLCTLLFQIVTLDVCLQSLEMCNGGIPKAEDLMQVPFSHPSNPPKTS
jgi:hypothetical protein